MMNFLGSNLGLYPGMGLFQLIGKYINHEKYLNILNGISEGVIGVLFAYKTIAKVS